MRHCVSTEQTSWLPVVSLGFAAFIFVTTELMPVGLLPDIADSFDKTESFTGLLVTGYAWVVALMSLPLTALSARCDRRILLLGLLTVFILGHGFAALAPSFSLLMAARICIALCHAIFWAIATPLATRVAPRGRSTRALSIIVTGVSLATVLGVPLGTLLGHHLGWRIAFAAVGAAGLVVLVLLAVLLPPQPSANTGSLRSVPGLLRRPALAGVYLLTLLTVTGHFTVFTYLAPFMSAVGGFTPETVAMLLLLLGGAGICGAFLGGRYADSRPRTALLAPLALVGLCVFCLPLVRFGLAEAMGLCFVWGAGLTAVTLIYQTRVLRNAPEAADVAIAMYSGIFNIGIGGGALTGSRVFAAWGVENVGWAGGAYIAAACVLAALALWKIPELGAPGGTR